MYPEHFEKYMVAWRGLSRALGLESTIHAMTIEHDDRLGVGGIGRALDGGQRL